MRGREELTSDLWSCVVIYFLEASELNYNTMNSINDWSLIVISKLCNPELPIQWSIFVVKISNVFISKEDAFWTSPNMFREWWSIGMYHEMMHGLILKCMRTDVRLCMKRVNYIYLHDIERLHSYPWMDGYFSKSDDVIFYFSKINKSSNLKIP